MSITIEPNRDPAPVAALNKTVQDIHAREYPGSFKPYDYGATLGFVREMLGQENWFSFLARADGEPAGYVLFFIRDYPENPFRKAYRATHIDQISVADDFQRLGIGTALMRAVEDFARSRDIHQLELTHWELNTHARRFYEKHGFTRLMNFVSRDI